MSLFFVLLTTFALTPMTHADESTPTTCAAICSKGAPCSTTPGGTCTIPASEEDDGHEIKVTFDGACNIVYSSAHESQSYNNCPPGASCRMYWYSDANTDAEKIWATLTNASK